MDGNWLDYTSEQHGQLLHVLKLGLWDPLPFSGDAYAHAVIHHVSGYTVAGAIVQLFLIESVNER